jgi:hypothetical protein
LAVGLWSLAWLLQSLCGWLVVVGFSLALCLVGVFMESNVLVFIWIC